MGTDALREAVEAAGRARMSAILQTARDEAERIRSEAESLSRAQRNDLLRSEEQRLRPELNRRTSAARKATRKAVLEARAALLDRIFSAARDALPAAMNQPESRTQLAARAQQALVHMPDGPVVFTASPDAGEVVEAALAGHDNVRVDLDPEQGSGFRAASGDGSLRVDATLMKLLDTERPTLAIEVLRRLTDEKTERNAS